MTRGWLAASPTASWWLVMSANRPASVYLTAYEECLVGHVVDNGIVRAVYSIERIITQLMVDGMDYDEAVEYFEKGLSLMYIGRRSPLYLEEWDMDDNTEEDDG
jgi:hypothetical protein